MPVEAGPHVVGVSFVRELWEPEGLPQPLQRGRVLTNDQLYMDYTAWVRPNRGPYKPPESVESGAAGRSSASHDFRLQAPLVTESTGGEDPSRSTGWAIDGGDKSRRPDTSHFLAAAEGQWSLTAEFIRDGERDRRSGILAARPSGPHHPRGGFAERRGDRLTLPFPVERIHDDSLLGPGRRGQLAGRQSGKRGAANAGDPRASAASSTI